MKHAAAVVLAMQVLTLSGCADPYAQPAPRESSPPPGEQAAPTIDRRGERPAVALARTPAAVAHRAAELTSTWTMERPKTLAAIAVSSLAATVGCGAGASEVDRITDTMQAFHRHAFAGETEEACALLTERGRDLLGGEADGLRTSCERRLSPFEGMLTAEQEAALGDTRIIHAEINGDRAVVRPQDLHLPAALSAVDTRADSSDIVFRRVDGRWLIEVLG